MIVVQKSPPLVIEQLGSEVSKLPDELAKLRDKITKLFRRRINLGRADENPEYPLNPVSPYNSPNLKDLRDLMQTVMCSDHKTKPHPRCDICKEAGRMTSMQAEGSYDAMVVAMAEALEKLSRQNGGQAQLDGYEALALYRAWREKK